LHDEAKKELQGKKSENEVFIIKSKFNKAKLHWFDKNTCKGLAIKHERNYNFCGSPNHWMQSCVKLSNEIDCHSAEHEHLKNLINMIKEDSDEEVDNFHDYNEALNKTNTLAIKVL
jgi:hypothetical protein